VTQTPFPLNSGQKAAAEGFFEWLFKPDEKEMIISGPGGVGKTHLMSVMIDDIIPRYHQTCQMMGMPPIYDQVQMTATTNKAAQVVAAATKRDTSTVQSFLNLKVTENYKTGESTLRPTNNWRVHGKLVLFVDEGSMIDTPLQDYILKGTTQAKIVYVGDHCQLSPVKERISPIYTRNLPFYELLEPMRTSNPALLAVNTQLRETVETGVFKPIKLVPGSIDLCDDGDIEQGIQLYFGHQTHDSRILAYTNQRVIDYNDHIRQMRGLPDEYTVGEFLVNNSAIQLKDRMLSVEEEITILSLDPTTEKRYIEENVYLEVRRASVTTGYGMPFDIKIPVDRPHFAALLRYFSSKKQWGMFYDLKKTYPDLRQRDAATFHKAQGSSYDSVFIDLTNLSTCHQPDTVARMLYVAFSRARTRVFLYGTLAAKYGGIIE
jgi:hypothetical protein